MFQRTLRALQELGLPALSHFGLYRLALRTGFYRWRLPARSWTQINLPHLLKRSFHSTPNAYQATRETTAASALFTLVSPAGRLKQMPDDLILDRANAIGGGRFVLFGQEVELGYPPDWHTFAPLVDTRLDHSLPVKHWSEYHIDRLPQDVKLLWEPSRFGWVYPLAQAFAISGDDRFYDIFWSLFSSWLEFNQPQQGLNWYSAQEAAIRLIALLFAAYTFSEKVGEDSGRWTDLMKAIAIHAERIPPTLSYARAQNNNHLLLESAALYLTGASFPEFERAETWKRRGRGDFEEGIRQQIFADGGYIQHSTNYQRLALQAGMIVALCAELEGEPLEEGTLEALERMTACLASQVEDKGGRVPNFGPNDGALLLPLSVCPFDDFRPTVQAAGKLFRGDGYYPAGPWDDLSLWLGVRESGIGQVSDGDALDVDFPQAGLYITHQGRLKTAFRAASFQSRPGHSDQMHLDIWYDGLNLARDPGSYLYNAPPPWDNSLSGAWCHNTIMLDQREPMQKGGRFLWLDWSSAQVKRYHASLNGNIKVLYARHRAGQWPGLLHQRSIAAIGGSLILVVDDVLGQGEHHIALNWNLADLAWVVEGSTIFLQHEEVDVKLKWPPEAEAWGLYRAGECVDGEKIILDSSNYGWHARSYAVKEPGLQLVVQGRHTLPARMVSIWAMNKVDTSKLVVDWSPITPDNLAFRGIHFGSEEWSR